MKIIKQYQDFVLEQTGVPTKSVTRLSDGTLWTERWMLNGAIHREDGPAVINYYTNGKIKAQMWWINGEQHRENAPAVINYYPDGTILSEEWWKEDLRHRTDGPATITYHSDGSTNWSVWYYDGQRIMGKDPLKQIDRKELIAGGISSDDLQILIDAGIV